MSLRKLKDVLLDGDNREMMAFRRKLVGYKQQLTGWDKYDVEEEIRQINEALNKPVKLKESL